jgi:Zn-dependent M28 family amino/carboxypeptidase
MGILEIALRLAKFNVRNAVRFGFWTAEEYGLIGSEHYVTTLPTEEVKKLSLYLNFDMIASPNFGYFVYDGDGNAFNITGPLGSDHIEHLFEGYFKSVGLTSAPTAFDGRSDYGPFLDANVPSGGLFTGAEGLKTQEEEKW